MGRRITSMAGRVTRILASPRREDEDQSVAGGDVVEFEFLDDVVSGEAFLANSNSSDEWCASNGMELILDDDDEDQRDNDASVEEDTSFWDNQHQLLQGILCRTSSIETGIRKETKETMKEIENNSDRICGCGREIALSSCRCCMMREVSRRLQNLGYNTAICKTKWRSSLHIPSGEHNFVDVIDNTSSKKGEVRVVVELNFRAEFEMARGSEEYNRLVRRLPEVFVGKAERLSNVIKIMCMAGKKCMKQKKMHMGPWRKQKYMQAKWLGPCERNTNWSSNSLFSNNNKRDSMAIMPNSSSKPKASMLTVDLLGILPNMHFKAVEVV